jgi:hypothetical protein
MEFIDNQYRSTYFYNIEKNDENVIDEYKIWYKNYEYTNDLYECYETALGGFIINNNSKSIMNYYSCDEEKENDKKKTLMTFTSEAVDIRIDIINIDFNNYHIKVTLINLLDKFCSENNEYVEMTNLMKQTKKDILEINKYYNDLPYKRSKEERDECKIDRLKERF